MLNLAMSNEVFSTTNLSVAAALLAASDKLSFHGVQADEDGRKRIMLVPRDEALRLYELYLAGDLLINAKLNSEWIQRLKKIIFMEKDGLPTSQE